MKKKSSNTMPNKAKLSVFSRFPQLLKLLELCGVFALASFLVNVRGAYASPKKDLGIGVYSAGFISSSTAIISPAVTLPRGNRNYTPLKLANKQSAFFTGTGQNLLQPKAGRAEKRQTPTMVTVSKVATSSFSDDNSKEYPYFTHESEIKNLIPQFQSSFFLKNTLDVFKENQTSIENRIEKSQFVESKTFPFHFMGSWNTIADPLMFMPSRLIPTAERELSQSIRKISTPLIITRWPRTIEFGADAQNVRFGEFTEKLFHLEPLTAPTFSSSRDITEYNNRQPSKNQDTILGNLQSSTRQLVENVYQQVPRPRARVTPDDVLSNFLRKKPNYWFLNTNEQGQVPAQFKVFESLFKSAAADFSRKSEELRADYGFLFNKEYGFKGLSRNTSIFQAINLYTDNNDYRLKYKENCLNLVQNYSSLCYESKVVKNETLVAISNRYNQSLNALPTEEQARAEQIFELENQIIENTLSNPRLSKALSLIVAAQYRDCNIYKEECMHLAFILDKFKENAAELSKRAAHYAQHVESSPATYNEKINKLTVLNLIASPGIISPLGELQAQNLIQLGQVFTDQIEKSKIKSQYDALVRRPAIMEYFQTEVARTQVNELKALANLIGVNKYCS